MRLSDEAAAVLWRAEGFVVESSEGRLGTVEDAVRIPGLSRPAALAVRVAAAGTRIVLVPITEIVSVDPAARSIRIGARPRLAERLPGDRRDRPEAA